MSSQPQPDIPPALQEAMAILDDDPAAAREKARAGLAGSPPDPRFWVVAGHASRRLEDWEDLEHVADGLLAAAPNAILGLIWKADCFSKRGELRQASSHYAAALRAADQAGELPEATRQDLGRVEREIAEIRRTYGWHLDRHLRSRGITPENCSRAFRETFAALAGTHEPTIDLQRPTMLFYPGLPQRPFYDATEFDWAAGMEAAVEVIRAEFEAVRTGPEALRSLGERSEDDTLEGGGAEGAPSLATYMLWEDGKPETDHLAQCPKTAALLETVSRPHFPNRCPIAAFWRFAPGTRIEPRHGMLNSRLIGHLPLITSGAGGLSVNGERRDWEPGKLVIFDDSIEHEIGNEGDGEAVVLLFDIARPEIDRADREALAALFEGVDSFQ
ncbi:MAG: aspartyl/asparaginyl beta-hydroxylase domain-containing protein [Sphingomonadales bacterium]|nr:aspartyl/asparaginyl beta-hydroxylase domain-containing protein [Sphingomonadales bacterium]